MDEVYRRALVVNVWLGLEPQNVTPCSSMGVTDGIDSTRGFQWEDAIPDLVNRPYWTRIWVIQEFILALRLEIPCGRNQISFLEFEHLIRKHLSNIGDGNLLMASLVQACAPAPMILERNLHTFSFESIHKLVELISRQQHSSCKDPRDRVFALLNLVFEEERDILTQVFPDYSMSEEKVMIITLACARFRYAWEITEDSDEILLGLGIKSRARRQHLLR